MITLRLVDSFNLNCSARKEDTLKNEQAKVTIIVPEEETPGEPKFDLYSSPISLGGS
jgi:hypothetical protein